MIKTVSTCGKLKLHTYITDNPNANSRQTARLIDAIENLKLSIKTTLQYANEAYSALRINDDYTVNEQEPVSRLIGTLGNQELLFNLSVSILDTKILNFVNSLKKSLKFDNVLKSILTTYFCIEIDDNHTEVATKITYAHSDNYYSNDIHNQAHYLMMLQIFSELLTKYDNYEDCSHFINQFADFFIKQFMRKNDENMATIIKFFSKELINRSKDARENQGLKEIIKQHLSSFENYLIHFVKDSCTDLDLPYDEQQSISINLQNFITKLVEKINIKLLHLLKLCYFKLESQLRPNLTHSQTSSLPTCFLIC